MINEKIKGFIESPVSNDFGLTIDSIAEKCKTYGRFNAWLNQDINKIKQVLNNVKNAGLSPAFFASYERTEGYNSSWGWLNHTVQKGDYFQDATSVSNVVITQSNNMSGMPSWIDYGNPVDFVPASVKSEGNTHFSTLAKGTIGRALIPLTAAATWEVYYPNGLSKEYNLVQDYAKPINLMVDTIIAWGGTIDESSPDPDEPSGVDVKDIKDILNKGKDELINSFNINFEPAKDYILLEFAKLFNHSLYNISRDFEINSYFKITNTFSNQMKINPKPKLFDDMLSIIIEGLKRIEINMDIDSVFDNIIDEMTDLFTKPNSPNEPVSKVFPVKIQNGINFWKSSNYGAGSVQYDMAYGYRASGDFHAGYDIGGGGSKHTIYAITDGTVTNAGWINGWGYRITIEHSNDKYHTLYAHLDSISVSVGDNLKAGDKIGIMGDTGGNYAIHLHVELSETGLFSDGNTIDPEPYLEVDGDNSTKLPQP